MYTVKPRYNVSQYDVFPCYNLDIFWPFPIYRLLCKTPSIYCLFQSNVEKFWSPEKRYIELSLYSISNHTCKDIDNFFSLHLET